MPGAERQSPRNPRESIPQESPRLSFVRSLCCTLTMFLMSHEVIEVDGLCYELASGSFHQK